MFCAVVSHLKLFLYLTIHLKLGIQLRQVLLKTIYTDLWGSEAGDAAGRHHRWKVSPPDLCSWMSETEPRWTLRVSGRTDPYPSSCLVSTVSVYNPTLWHLSHCYEERTEWWLRWWEEVQESVIFEDKDVHTNPPHTHSSEAALRAQSSSWFLVRSSP